MNIGDLVKWTSPNAAELGIAIEPWVDVTDVKYMIVYWFSTQASGPVPIGHKYLEVVGEHR